MQFHLLKLIFFKIIIFIYHPSTFVVAQYIHSADLLYQYCSSTQIHCGKITNITYPFWGLGRPSYCGHPGFHLNCNGHTLFININQLTYKILRIDSNSPTLTLARTDYIYNICLASFINTTLDQTLFKFTSNLQNITLYYDCLTYIQIPNASLLPNEFYCIVDGDVSAGYFQTGGLTSYGHGISLGSCNESVIVPAFESAASFVESNPSVENLNVALNQGFGLQWNTNYLLCESCMSSGGTCGSNTTDNSFVCYCPDQPYPFTCPGKDDQSSFSVFESGLITAAIVLSCLGCFGCCCFWSRRERSWVQSMFFGLKKTKQEETVETFIKSYQSRIAKRYSYWDISKMTNAFADKLGQGGFGGVYKGKLPDGRLVAVKVLNKSTGDGEEFINEVATISRTSHVNIVTLLGFCFARNKRALIYEYLPNGSLNNYINDYSSQLLEWKTLYEIAIGIARGLEYLHRGCNTRIVHFDIKPHNILLDESFCPKIADFGLAKLCKGNESIVSMLGARGTLGYIAPEVLFMRDFGRVSYKSDVYSYGKMILEMFTGKDTNNIDDGISQTSEIYFVDWIYKHLEPGMISRVHENVSAEEEETVRRMIIVGLWCIQTNPSDRPSMTKVVEMLEASLESLQIPPKPCLFSTCNTTPKFSSILSSSPLYLWSIKEEEKVLSLA